jgi:hypothetical protein
VLSSAWAGQAQAMGNTASEVNPQMTKRVQRNHTRQAGGGSGGVDVKVAGPLEGAAQAGNQQLPHARGNYRDAAGIAMLCSKFVSSTEL